MFTSITRKIAISYRGNAKRAERRHTCAFTLLGLTLHAWQSLGDSSEQLLHVVADLRTGFDKHEAVLLSLLLALSGGDFPLVVQIGLVADQYNDHVIPTLPAHIIDPFPGVLEGLSIRNIVYDDRHAGVTDVRGDQGAESFLAGGIPELKADRSVFQVHRL